MATSPTHPQDDHSRWRRPAGYREVLLVAIPLVLSTSTWTIQHFVDRMFLSWYDADAMAAALPAGLLAFTFISLFMGTASYANVFVAQYFGSGQNHRIGPALWQAVWFAFATGALMVFVAFGAEPIFHWVGHSEPLRAYETEYFRIHMFGGFVTVYINALTSLYAGRGKNWPILWVNIVITICNLILDYGLIFGRFGLPGMGIAGAALATVIANAAGALIFTAMVLSPENHRAFATRAWRIDLALLKRLLRFGLPSGAQFMLDILAITFFTILVGRIGGTELAATNLAFQVNMLAFMPMIGGGIAIQTLVGQYLGAERPELAARATWSAFHMSYGYMVFFAILYLAIPDLFLVPFAAKADPEAFAAIRPMAVTILRFVAIYCLFDTMTITFSSTLKGAGDTRFVMWYALVLGWVLMVIPTWVAIGVFDGGIIAAWSFLTLYISVTAIGFLLRFLQGKWRSMRVIEPTVAALPADLPGAPMTEVDAPVHVIGK